MARPTLTLVVPIYNEEAVIPELDARLRAALAELERVVDSWEVIFVDDGSKDRSLELLAGMAGLEPRFKVLSFSRNFGHQLAITAGLDRAEGEAVVVMDADLQDPPEVVASMVEKWRSGFDVVYGVRLKRHGETLFKRFTAALFYRAFRSMLGGIDMPLDAGDFRLMSRPAVLALHALRERHRFVRGMVAWIGFKQTAVHYDRDARFAGDTKYPLRKMLRFAVDGITSFSILPLRIATWLGILSGVAATGIGGWTLYIKIFASGVVTGWTTIMMLTAFGFSAQLLMTGILGEYLGRIYEEVKRRPLYISAKELNFSNATDSVRPQGSLEKRK
jgi:glycosyltransferase involved in cell wall biosynthesis